MKIDLSGRTAVIVGGSGGLGEAMADTLSGAGAAIALVGRNKAKLEEVAQALAAKGGTAATFTAEMTNEDDVARLQKAVEAWKPRPQILINSAGTNIRKDLVDFTLDEFRSVLDSSIISTFLGCRAFVPGMKGTGYGRIINLTSIMAHISLPWRTVVGVSALFVVVDVALSVGLRDLLVAVTLPGTSPAALYVLGGAGALAANAVNNLPAYLALESVASDAPERLIALLVGVNAGPLVTVWGSVATLLWQQRCRSLGLAVSAGYLAREGLLCATVVVTAALTALVLVR